MNAAELLRDARRQRRLTQRELAQLAGFTQTEIARIETGATRPRTDTLDRLLRACGFDVELVARGGEGVDRMAIRRLMALTPAERARLATEEGRNLDGVLTHRR
jgi:transcriptional regulator with XRE-family HTH domain